MISEKVLGQIKGVAGEFVTIFRGMAEDAARMNAACVEATMMWATGEDDIPATEYVPEVTLRVRLVSTLKP